MLQRLFVIATAAFIFTTTHAKEIKGITFADEIKVGKSTLKLNGVGIRKAYSILDVYLGALYVEQPTSDAEVIINSKTTKQIILNFMRFVDSDKMKAAWKEGFFKNADKAYSYRSDLQQLSGYMKNMNEKDQMIFTFLPDSVEVQVKNEPVQIIQSADASKTLLKVFIHIPPDEDLKKGMLGK